MTGETPCSSCKDDTGTHCDHWYDADECCWCGDPALTDEELEVQGAERG